MKMIKCIVLVAFMMLGIAAQAQPIDLPLTRGLTTAVANKFNLDLLHCAKKENDGLTDARSTAQVNESDRVRKVNGAIAKLRKKPSMPLPHELIQGAINDTKADKLQKEEDARPKFNVDAATQQIVQTVTAAGVACRKTASTSINKSFTDAQMKDHWTELAKIRATASTTSLCKKRQVPNKPLLPPTCQCQEVFPAGSGVCLIKK